MLAQRIGLVAAAYHVMTLGEVGQGFFEGFAKGLKRGVLIQLEDQFFDLLLSAHEDGVCEWGATVETPSVDSDISSQGEHFLFEKVSRSWINSLHLEVEMERFPLHQPQACGIDANLLHVMDGFPGIGDVEAPYQAHLFVEEG